jgi:hypothetical protein
MSQKCGIATILEKIKHNSDNMLEKKKHNYVIMIKYMRKYGEENKVERGRERD